jgi:hypothetical protein
MDTMIGSSLSQVVCVRACVFLCYLRIAMSNMLSHLMSLCSEFRSYDVLYDFRIKTMFATSLSPVVRRKILISVLCMLFVFVCVQWCPTRIVLAI